MTLFRPSLVAIALSIFALGIGGLVFDNFWALRVALLLFVAFGIHCLGETGRMSAISSPGFLLAAIALAFYSLLPALAIEALLGSRLPIEQSSTPHTYRPDILGRGLDYLRYVPGSEGEMAVIAMSLLLLFAVFCGAWLFPTAQRRGNKVSPGATILMIVVAGASYQGARRVSFDGLSGGLQPLVVSLTDTLPYILTLGIAVCVQNLEDKRHRLAALLGIVVAAFCLVPFSSKTACLMAGIVFVRWLSTVRRGQAAGMFAALLVLPMLGAVFTGMARNSLPDLRLPSISETLFHKMVVRQAESVFCLHFALTEAGSPSSDGPLYFAGVLIPRLVWPEKPVIQTGIAHGSRYCGVDYSAASTHSASITLIGEPAARAGKPGLAVAAAILVGISLLSIWGARSQGGLRSSAVLALSPWLIDFDQSFSLYIGNAVKGALVIGACIFMIAIWSRRRSGIHP